MPFTGLPGLLLLLKKGGSLMSAVPARTVRIRGAPAFGCTAAGQGYPWRRRRLFQRHLPPRALPPSPPNTTIAGATESDGISTVSTVSFMRNP